MSSGGEDDLVTLALALLKRGASPGQVLDVMGEQPDEPGRKKRGPRPVRAEKGAAGNPPDGRSGKRPINHRMVVAALRDAPGPLTALELADRLPLLTAPAALRHMYRGVQIGTIVRHGAEKPFRYTASKGGVAQLGLDFEKAPRGSGAKPAETGPLYHAAVIAAVARMGTAQMATLRDAFPGASRTALYQHLTRGVSDGELSRTGKGQLITWQIKGAAKARASEPQHNEKTPRPNRIDEIAAVIRKAGRPLGCIDIVPQLPHLSRGNVEQHLSMGVHSGRLVRLGKKKPFTYTVKPAKGKAVDGRSKHAPKVALVRRDEFLAALRKAPGPLPVKELYKYLPDMQTHSVDTGLANAVKRGDVVRTGKKKPYLYQVKPEPTKPGSANGSHANGALTSAAALRDAIATA